MNRSCGVLLHVTSLPGPQGIGDLGPCAYGFVDLLHRGRQGFWQVLPLGPTGYGDSPYQCFSAFAGNPLLISLEQLARDGLLSPEDVPPPQPPSDRVDYEAVSRLKQRATARAFERLMAGQAPQWEGPLERFCREEAAWLRPYAIFMAVKHRHGEAAWQEWGGPYRLRRPEAVARIEAEAEAEIRLHEFRQFLFFDQWRRLRSYAHRHGVRLVGDMPIFVANDSSDVWSRPELFLLDAERRPHVVAGVPPDYFSEDGQRWGNPLYDWDAHQREGFAWWLDRLRSALELFDLVRLDHFRGFEAYWAIAADCQTARDGRWVPAPGRELLQTACRRFGQLPLIAEDLGEITPPVHRLRQEFGFPGMRVLQFAFGGAQEDRFLPHHFDANTVVYTGTHDNETTAGWHKQLTRKERRFFARYAPSAKRDPVGTLIRLAWASVADLAVVPMQDLLRLGNEARMNHPGQPTGNWRWRPRPEQFDAAPFDALSELTETYQRAAAVAPPKSKELPGRTVPRGNADDAA